MRLEDHGELDQTASEEDPVTVDFRVTKFRIL
jgi:hypothetical protein